MRARSGHIIFKKGTKYKDLAPIYKELFMKFLKDTDQVPDEDEITNMMVRTNLMDLERNRKPEGYNRYGNMRMIFPIDSKMQFYLYSQVKSTQVVKVTESLSKYLQKKGLKHSIEWDQMILDDYKEKKR